MLTLDQLTVVDFVENCPGKPADKVKSTSTSGEEEF
jgi:hypothetical protein